MPGFWRGRAARDGAAVTRPLSRGRIAAFYLTAAGALAVVASAADIWPTRLVYNPTASVPVGWYAVDAPEGLVPGDYVVVWPPIAAERLLIERGYLGTGVPLVKQIGAVPGATVCRHNGAITIDGTPAALARDADRVGRPLPLWSGCRRLGPDQVFLLNSGAPGSFDGRYFGPSPARDIVGKARPLWTW